MSRTIDELGRDLGEARKRRLEDVIHSTLVEAGTRAKTAAQLNATTRLRVRSGRLRAGIVDGVEMRPTPRLILSNDVVYAGTQEYGATITPRRGKYLAQPLRAAQTPTGQLRAEFRGVSSLREIDGLFVIKAKRSGRLFLARNEGANGDKLVLYFRLIRSAKIEPTYFMRDGLLESADWIRAELPRRIRDVILGKGGRHV